MTPAYINKHVAFKFEGIKNNLISNIECKSTVPPVHTSGIRLL